ncbi:MAG: hypothetical protein FH751_15435 [Firmicutes bacterium]|nr:hypothetical protein [Bacillota bacterium]
MKKILSFILVGSLVFSMGAYAFADSTDTDVPTWFLDMIEWRKGQVQQAVEDGDIQKQQGIYYNEHFEEMEKFHRENDFPADCGRGFNRGHGYGWNN